MDVRDLFSQITVLCASTIKLKGVKGKVPMLKNTLCRYLKRCLRTYIFSSWPVPFS